MQKGEEHILDRSSIYQFTSQFPVAVGSGPDQNQEPRIQFSSHNWMAGTQVVELSLAAS